MTAGQPVNPGGGAAVRCGPSAAELVADMGGGIVVDPAAGEPLGECSGAYHPVTGERLNAPTVWPEPLDLAALSTREPAPPAFIIDDWLPVGYATLFAGHGGVGKSGIALQLATSIALGAEFCGLEAARRRVVYLSCEDRENVLHWRLSRLCKHFNVNMAALAGWLDLFDLVGHETVLWERDPRTSTTLTRAYGVLKSAVLERGAQVIFVDGISDTFGGNENAKTDVKRFINGLVSLIPAESGAVVLIGHIAKPAATSGQTTEGYSGTTGWHNGVRARWYLHPEITQNEDREQERTGDLILELQKSNLGRTDQALRFAWSEASSLFVGREIVAATASDHAHRDRSERDGIAAALAACATSGVIVPAATSGQRTAYHVLSARSEFPETLRGGTPGKRRFWRHLEALRAMGRVNDAEWRQKDRRYSKQLVLSSEDVRACGQ